MARFNTIKIGTVYLTQDGTSGAAGCKCDVEGLDALKSAYTGAVVTAVDGTPFQFIQANTGKGSKVAIKPYVLTQAVFNSLKTALDASVAGNTTLNVTISGDTGSFDLQCIPDLPKPLSFSGKFINGRIYEVTINLIVSSIN